MFLDDFHQANGSHLTVTAAQASRFAKQVADDFNPLHDEDAKRFCVPGDLLFALLLSKYGLSQRMRFEFSGMVGADTELVFEPSAAATLQIDDTNGKHYLSAERSGDISQDESLIEAFIRQYVAFSGHNFPHVLVPLMRQAQVMINPARPLVIYESMAFNLEQLAITAPSLKQKDATIAVEGKRGDVELNFDIYSGADIVGHGVKKLVLSGLRPYDEAAMQAICADYDARKSAFNA